MNPTFSPRKRDCSSPVKCSSGWSSRMYLPDVGVSKSHKIFMSVDFPEPEGPMIDTKSPSLIVIDMFFNTSKTMPHMIYDFVIFSKISIELLLFG